MRSTVTRMGAVVAIAVIAYALCSAAFAGTKLVETKSRENILRQSSKHEQTKESVERTDKPSVKEFVEEQKEVLIQKVKSITQNDNKIQANYKELEKALEAIKANPGKLEVQSKYVTALIGLADQLLEQINETRQADLQGTLDRLIKGYHELSAIQLRAAKECELRMKNSDNQVIAKHYATLAAIAKQTVRTYSYDIRYYEGIDIKSKVQKAADQVEFLNFFKGYMLQYRDQLELMVPDQDVIDSLTALNVSLDQLVKSLNDFSSEINAENLRHGGRRLMKEEESRQKAKDKAAAKSDEAAANMDSPIVP